MAATTIKPGAGGIQALDAVQIGGSGSAIWKVVAGTVTVDLASMTTGLCVVKAVTITGVALGDLVIITGPDAGVNAGVLIGQAWVTAADTVNVSVINGTAGTLDPASATFRYFWFDFSE